MMATVSATLATEPQSRFTLIHGNRSSQGMMFRQALVDLKTAIRSACASESAPAVSSRDKRSAGMTVTTCAAADHLLTGRLIAPSGLRSGRDDGRGGSDVT
ncbi:hypothetical protein MJ561_13470 [Klebsiella pneumoniae]|nr:hypothetical protein MJ561_13470 [Klebsiella pneumoniae]